MKVSIRTWITLALALGMGGCASVSTLQAQIASYGQWPAGRAPGSYAFDRLPSQQAQPDVQQMLEDAAHRALTAAGFTAATAGSKPDVLVQLGARVTRYDSGPWGDPFWGHGGWHGYGYAGGWYRRPWVGAYPYAYPYWSGYYSSWTYYDRQVALMMRDGASGEALYEARARSDAYSNNSETLAAMFRAALADFPKSGSVPHSVDITLAP
ncbi:MAG TPA: DUF4136 domain-containing protein [Burkholderiaceae bacterium]|nr:DUF4136 domain-containing protein [Burkholderiaceae bacterium]